jgi:hypothetical protein
MLSTRRTWAPVATVALALAAFCANAEDLHFRAVLTGAAQVPEPTKSKATGQLDLTVQDGGKKISYTLTVTDLQNAFSSELHLGEDNMNGPAVVKLFPAHGASAKKGAFSGVLAEGTITAADLLGPMVGSPLSDLVDELSAGKAYVNVHTNDGMDPPESGPGDYRKGEIRGQIAVQ